MPTPPDVVIAPVVVLDDIVADILRTTPAI
jgi:hypothetical protein